MVGIYVHFMSTIARVKQNQAPSAYNENHVRIFVGYTQVTGPHLLAAIFI